MVDIRRASAADVIPIFEAMRLQFSFDLPESAEDRAAFSDRILAVSSIERSIIAEEGDTIVGTLGSFDLDLTVPGGTLACGGTTWVTVSPLHRRRGVLRQMMSAHFDEAVERGDAVTGLWSSDSAIYGRFGYGMAAQSVAIEIDRATATFCPGLPTPDQVEMISVAEAETLLPAFYNRIRRSIPGTFGRSEAWWKHRTLRDTEEARDGKTRLRIAVARGADRELSGYALFRMEGKFDGAHSDDRLHVVDLLGSSPESWLALWSLVLGFDLVTTIESRVRPLDDPLFEFLAGIRRAKRTVSDSLWIRVLDLPRALTGRTYDIDGSVVFEVSDAAGLGSGTWRLETENGTARCEPSTQAADLEVDISHLGAALLGAPRLTNGVRAGAVSGTIEAAAEADRLFTGHRTPFCPEVF